MEVCPTGRDVARIRRASWILRTIDKDKVLYLADQGDEASKVGLENLRTVDYEAWNDVMESI